MEHGSWRKNDKELSLCLNTTVNEVKLFPGKGNSRCGGKKKIRLNNNQ